MIPLWPSSLRSRLTLWYTLLLLFPLSAFGLLCYVVVAQTLERRTDAFIRDALTAFSRELSAERRVDRPVNEAIQRTVEEVRFHELHIAVLDAQGQLIAVSELEADDAGRPLRSTDGSPLSMADVESELLKSLRRHDLSKSVELTVPVGKENFRAVSHPWTSGQAVYAVTGTYSLRDIDAVLRQLRGIFQIAIPILIIAALRGGNVLARRSLYPVAAMATRTGMITERNLHERIPITGGDELEGLARVINGLLDRLEASFDRQRRFIADASHELRTPTAVVRTEADVTLSREHRSEEDYRGSVSIIRDASDRLARIVDDLFLLSRADSGHLVPRRDELYLEEIVHNATRAVGSVASQRGVTVQLGHVYEAQCVGDADLLGRVILNLLDNAIKYSPSGATVAVVMSRQTSFHEVTVTDDGPGIPAADRERIFERFVRLDAARARDEDSATSGAGLGLAIARRMAEFHGGKLDLVESRPGRTVFRVLVPVSVAA